jgi:hypothetical protein
VLGRGVPAFEDRDEPVRVALAGRRAAPVTVRQQEIEHRRFEFKQGLIGSPGVVVHVDGAQDTAVDLAKFGRAESAEAIGDVVEAVAAAGVAAMTAGGLGVTVQADPHPDAEIPEHLEHGPAEAGAVSLDRYVDPGRHAGVQVLG